MAGIRSARTSSRSPHRAKQFARAAVVCPAECFVVSATQQRVAYSNYCCCQIRKTPTTKQSGPQSPGWPPKSTSSFRRVSLDQLLALRLFLRLACGVGCIVALEGGRQIELQADERTTRAGSGSSLIGGGGRVVVVSALQLHLIDNDKLFASLDVAHEAAHVLILSFDRHHHGDARIKSLPLRGD